MRKLWIVVFSALILLGAVLITRAWLATRARNQRKAKYALELQAYRSAFPNSTTRGKVEAYLQAKATPFVQRCCDAEGSAYSDLVFIGREPAPWYCSEHNVYIEFQFGSGDGALFQSPLRDVTDILKSIKVQPQLKDCL